MELAHHLSSKYNVMSDFLINNRLKLNNENTHIMVMSTSQTRAIKDSSLVMIRTPTEVIKPSETEKLLGCCLHQDIKVAEHLPNNEESLLSALNKRIGALKILGRVANFT